MNQDQLRAKSLALFHALVSNFANDLRREVTGVQDELIQKLDALQERMSKYEETIDEDRIVAFSNEMAALLGAGPGAGSGSGTLKRLRHSLGLIDEGTSLTEVLTLLLEELSHFAPRVALFILKGGSCIGWNGRGFDESPGFNNEGLKRISVPASAETVFKAVIQSRASFVGPPNAHGDNVQLLSRIGSVLPSSIFATPLILRDRIAGVVYADTGDATEPLQDAEALEILTVYAAKLLDALSAQKGTGKTGEQSAPRGAAASAGPASQPRAPSPSPPPTPAPTRTPTPSRAPVSSRPQVPLVEEEEEEESGTVIFNAADMNLPGSGATVEPPASTPSLRPTPPTEAAPVELESLDPETRKKHEEAMRFARLLVSEIKLYNEAKVQQGRQSRDLYHQLKDDIERSRQLYRERVSEPIRAATSYFNDELIRILADGDEGAMGQPLPAS